MLPTPLLFFGLGAIGWPLLVFVFCRYQLRLNDQWVLRWTILAFGIAAVVAIGLGDSMISLERAGRSSASLFVVRGIVFGFPYFLLALWLTVRSLLRFRHDRSTPSI